MMLYLGIVLLLHYVLIAARHQPAVDHILEQFEIFRSMVPLFDRQSVTAALWSQRFG